MARINNPLRKKVSADLISNVEEIDSKGKTSKKTSRSVIDGRPKIDRLDTDDLYQAFSTRFNFYIDESESTAVIDNIKCAVIKFRPKPNLKADGLTDQIINRLTGSVYINIDNFQIIKIEGSINYHFYAEYVAWFLLNIPIGVDFYQFYFLVEYTVFNDIVIEKNLIGTADYEIRNRGTEKHHYTLSNYRFR